MKENVKITLTIELSPDIYKHLAVINNLSELLKDAALKKLFELALELTK